MTWSEEQYAEITAIAAARWPTKPYAVARETWNTMNGWLAAVPFEHVRASLLYIADAGEQFPSIKRLVDVARTLPR